MKFLFTSLSLLTPFLVSAQLVPDCEGFNCNFCHLVELAQNIINFLVLVSIALAAIAFAWAGFLYMTSAGDQGKVKKAHDVFKKVAIGLIIVLGAYLIVNLVVYGLTGGNVNEMFNC